MSDELACFAMQCHVAAHEIAHEIDPSELWSPLRGMGSVGGKEGGACASPPLQPPRLEQLDMRNFDARLFGGCDERLESASAHPSQLLRSPLSPSDAHANVANARGVAGHPSPPLATGLMDSPLDPGMPGLTKREVSFSTHMVRRAVSFLFNDSVEAPETTYKAYTLDTADAANELPRELAARVGATSPQRLARGRSPPARRSPRVCAHTS